MLNKIILASKSKVRKEILDKHNISCEVKPSFIDEDIVKESLISELASPKIMQLWRKRMFYRISNNQIFIHFISFKYCLIFFIGKPIMVSSSPFILKNRFLPSPSI